MYKISKYLFTNGQKKHTKWAQFEEAIQMYWTPFISHFASINFNGWRADKETTLSCFSVKTLIKKLEVKTVRRLGFSFSRLELL
jgi:hypothetical protein